MGAAVLGVIRTRYDASSGAGLVGLLASEIVDH
jgi:hypothetical protein